MQSSNVFDSIHAFLQLSDLHLCMGVRFHRPLIILRSSLATASRPRRWFLAKVCCAFKNWHSIGRFLLVNLYFYFCEFHWSSPSSDCFFLARSWSSSAMLHWVRHAQLCCAVQSRILWMRSSTPCLMHCVLTQTVKETRTVVRAGTIARGLCACTSIGCWTYMIDQSMNFMPCCTYCWSCVYQHGNTREMTLLLITVDNACIVGHVCVSAW